MEYITDLCIQKAKELITSTDLKIQEFAESVDYVNTISAACLKRKKLAAVKLSQVSIEVNYVYR